MTASTQAVMRLAALGWTEPPWWRPFKRRAWRGCVAEWQAAVIAEACGRVAENVAARAVAAALGSMHARTKGEVN